MGKEKVSVTMPLKETPQASEPVAPAVDSVPAAEPAIEQPKQNASDFANHPKLSKFKQGEKK